MKETGAGIVVAPDNPNGAAQELNDFIKDEKQLKKAGKAAFDLAKNKFDRDILAKKLMMILVETSSSKE